MNGDIDANGDVDSVVLPPEEALHDSLTEVSLLASAGAAGTAGSEIAISAGDPCNACVLSDRGEAVLPGGNRTLLRAASPASFVRLEDEWEARQARLVGALDLDSTVDLVEHLAAITSELARAARRPQPYPFYAR